MSFSPPKPAAVPGRRLRVGVVAARYNPEWVERLLDRTLAGLRDAGVPARGLAVLRVPGSGELPAAAQGLIARFRPHALVALGVIVRGGTLHYELLADSVGHALQRVALDSGVPVINGVVVAENARQARERAGGRVDRGSEFAAAALAMAALRQGGWR